MSEDETSHELFERAQNKQIDAEATELIQETPDATNAYYPASAATDLKTSIIEVTRPTDERIRELLVKELTLSNITKGEVRIGMLYINVILSFFMHGQAELAREWLGKFEGWLLLNRSVDFKQQQILATTIKTLMTGGGSKPEKKDVI